MKSYQTHYTIHLAIVEMQFFYKYKSQITPINTCMLDFSMVKIMKTLSLFFLLGPFSMQKGKYNFLDFKSSKFASFAQSWEMKQN